MKLPDLVVSWPEEWLHAYQERESILWADGVPDSERLAEMDTRRQAELRGQAEMFAGGENA
jgi:hypothetical protein